ncbi:hypothetical protein ACFLWX_02725 [Chloroflexota bacterium]
MNGRKKLVLELPVWDGSHKTKRIHVARVRELGLTAYGKSQHEADNKLKSMVDAYVKAHSDRGALEECLNESGLKWYWKEDLPNWKGFEQPTKKQLVCV